MGIFEKWVDWLRKRNLLTGVLMLYDIVAVNLAYFLALWIRFDCKFSSIDERYLQNYIHFTAIYTVFCLGVFWALHLYKSIWRYASFTELMRVLTSSFLTAVFHAVAITLLFGRMPASYYLFGALIQFLLIIGVRFSYRFILLERSRRSISRSADPTMLIGAGSAGQMILRDIIRAKETDLDVKCIIDDNPNKRNRYLEGVPIVGGREDILVSVEKYRIKKILVAIPSASAEDQREILNICNETGCELKMLPGIYQLVNGEISVDKMRDVAVEDLLGPGTHSGEYVGNFPGDLRQDHSGDGRRRFHWQRAVPSDRRARPQTASDF